MKTMRALWNADECYTEVRQHVHTLSVHEGQVMACEC